MTKVNNYLAMIVAGIGLAALSQLWVADEISDPAKLGINVVAAVIGVAGMVLAVRSVVKLHRHHRTKK